MNPICIRRDAGRLWAGEGDGLSSGDPSLGDWANAHGGFPPSQVLSLGLAWSKPAGRKINCPIISTFSHTLNTMHLVGEGPSGAARPRVVGSGKRLSRGLPGRTRGMVFPRGAALPPTPDPAVSEMWATAVGGDPGLAEGLGAVVDGVLLWGCVLCRGWRGVLGGG